MAADAEAGADALNRLGIDLGEYDPRLKPRRRALELGRHHLARATPRGPEVDEDGDIALLDVLQEARFVIKRHRVAGKKLRLAFAADSLAGVGEPWLRNAVQRVATRTKDGQRHGQALLPCILIAGCTLRRPAALTQVKRWVR
jgi:hypothetical protein